MTTPSQYFVRLCGLLIVVLGTSVPAIADCNCPRMLYMTVNSGGQTYRYYMSTRYDDSVSPCVAKTTTTMYSANALNTSSVCCGGDCVMLPAGAPVVPVAAAAAGRSTDPDQIPSPKNVDPITSTNLKKAYIANMELNTCAPGTDCWKVTALKNVESFYFQLERVDGSVVWVHAMVHRVKFKITTSSGVEHKTKFVANGLQIDGDPPAGADTMDGTYTGTMVGTEKHIYQVGVGAFNVTTVTTAIP